MADIIYTYKNEVMQISQINATALVHSVYALRRTL